MGVLEEDWRDRVVLVTGGTRGIGLAVARQLTAAGTKVAVAGRDPVRAEEIASQLPGANCGIGGDLSRAASARAVVAEVLRRMGRLDGLINNAGVSWIQPSSHTSDEDWARVVDLNLKAAFFCAQAAESAFGDSGVIINIASVAGLTGLPGRAAYAASKAGLIALTRVLAVEWAPRVRVNAVAPGYIRTDAMDALIAQGGVEPAAIEGRTPAGRFGTPEDVAHAVLFLLSSRASFVSGEVLVVDGGWLANGAAPITRSND